MHHQWNTAEILMLMAAALLAAEATLAGFAAINSRYGAADTVASLSMYADNLLMNVLMTGIVFAGLSAVYRVRLFTIPPGSVWAWLESEFNLRRG